MADLKEMLKMEEMLNGTVFGQNDSVRKSMSLCCVT